MAQKPREENGIYVRKIGLIEKQIRAEAKRRKIYSQTRATTYNAAFQRRRGARSTALCAYTSYERSPIEDVSFAHIAKEWFDRQLSSLKPASLSSYANIIYAYLIPEFSHRTISEISQADVAIFVHKLLKNGGVKKQSLSANTVATHLAVLRNVLHFAAQEKNLPVADITKVSIRGEKRGPEILSIKDQEKLAKWLYLNLCPCNLGILLALYTGMRLGELCALKWKDISREDQSITICRSMQRISTTTERMLGSKGAQKQKAPQCREIVKKQDCRQSETKTKIVVQAPKSPSSIRTIPVTKEIGHVLEQNRKEDEAYLLTGERNRFIENRSPQRRFKKVLKECGLRDTNFHTLRHTFATRGAEIGFETKALSSVLGHSSVSTTLDLYVHPSLEEKRRNMDLFSTLFTGKQA